MSLGRSLLARALIAACALVSGSALADGIRFVSPRAEDVINGATRVTFRVIREGRPLARIEVYERGRLVGVARRPDYAFEWRAPARPEGVLLRAFAFDDGGEIVDRASVRTRRAGTIGSVDVTAALSTFGSDSRRSMRAECLVVTVSGSRSAS